MREKTGNGVDRTTDIRKLQVLLPSWLKHNEDHLRGYEKWLTKMEGAGLHDTARAFRHALEEARKTNERFEQALRCLEREAVAADRGHDHDHEHDHGHEHEHTHGALRHVKQIGIIRTPYREGAAPYQPIDEAQGEFRIVLEPQYAEGLKDLATFRYLYVLAYIHKLTRKPAMTVTPPWAGGRSVGVFASRSPARPNPIGLSVVRIRKIENNEIHTSGLDVFDGTPVLDLKPYVKGLDSKEDADYGWIEGFEDREHLTVHLKGIPHDY
jgi:tRNA-Thr(GGU) m(6)t(6)A37 methyltransferase TsaA